MARGWVADFAEGPESEIRRPFEGRIEVVQRIVPRIIARYEGKSENE